MSPSAFKNRLRGITWTYIFDLYFPPLHLASVIYYINLEEFHILDLAFILYFRRFLLDRPALLRISGHKSAALTFLVRRHVRTDRGRTISKAFL